ncbi:hypothetical protein EVAR_96854_1 [Eumeta japonica]|uniref:Uncharacterized protein n=1 Tax=Eumeta variegata TaxID=151549 RepID=A0A4C1WNV6_EUMVA|nr:hypothetical protein EVAR_96854_1 [Eumeta japonica]
MILDKKMNEVPVRFCDVRFDSDVIATHDEVLVFNVTIQKGSGQFEVTHKSNMVARGRIRTLSERNISTVVIEPVEDECVTFSEIYKLFHLRGYEFRRSRRAITEQMVTVSHGHSLSQRNHQYVAGLLGGNKIYTGRGI